MLSQTIEWGFDEALLFIVNDGGNMYILSLSSQTNAFISHICCPFLQMKGKQTSSF